MVQCQEPGLGSLKHKSHRLDTHLYQNHLSSHKNKMEDQRDEPDAAAEPVGAEFIKSISCCAVLACNDLPINVEQQICILNFVFSFMKWVYDVK